MRRKVLEAATPDCSKSPRGILFTALGISLATFLIYLPSQGNGFVNWDDNLLVYENTFIRSFDNTLFQKAFLEFYASNWHPLTWISHAAVYAVWGLNPFGHHLTNSLLHALNTFLVFLLASRLIERATRRGA
jgi:hypothetical protein